MNIRFTRYVVSAVAGLALMGGATLVQASSLNQSQISAIIGLLQSFGADPSVIANVTASLNGQATPGGPSCVNLSFNLASGATDAGNGGDVTRLQNFLGVNQTGYFGPQTENAVENWQSSHGILSAGSPDTNGYGYVGAKTRKMMGCGVDHNPYTPQPNKPTLSATPAYGQTSGAPTCSFKSSTGAANGISWNTNDSQTKENCISKCVISRNEKFGISDHGWCTYTDSLGTPTTQPIEKGTATPTATIDYDLQTVAAPGSFTLAGYASNFTSVNSQTALYIGIVPSSYSGTLDLKSIGGKGDSGPFLQGTNEFLQNGRWSHSFYLANPGAYKVVVYDYWGSSMPAMTGSLTVAGSNTSCVAPHITVPSPLPGYSLELYPTNVGAGQMFSADQEVTYSATNLPSWMSLSGNKVTFNTIPTPGKYSFTITATNFCGRTDTEIIPVTVSTLPSSITITGTTRPHVTFSYANLPTTDMQGMFLVNLSTGANVLSFGVSGSVGMGSALVPDSAPAGRYLLRVLAVMNNRTIVESAPFDLGL